MKLDRDLVRELAADPSPERYMVFADVLQTQGDPRGELIALDLHARATGQPRDRRADEIESQLGHELNMMMLGSGTSWMTWELGFPRELTIPSGYIPEIQTRHWFEADSLLMLRSLRLADQHGSADDAQPIELLANAPFHATLEHLAIGSATSPLVGGDALRGLFEKLACLRGVELQAGIALDHERLTALEQLERLESLTLWAPADDALLERLIDTPWPRLRTLGLALRGAAGRETPQLMIPLLEGTRHRQLIELSLYGCGFEDALLYELGARRPLRDRLQRLGLVWRSTSIPVLEEVADELAAIELIWKRPPGVPLAGDDHYQLARRLRAGLGRTREALVQAKYACQVTSRTYVHWTELGHAHDRLDELPEALAAMERAISLDPDRWDGWAGCGDMLRKLGRYEEAHEIYRRGLARLETRSSLHHGRGKTFACEGKVDDAIAAYENAVLYATSDDHRAWYRGCIGAALLHHDRIAEARDHIARARALDPTNARLARFDGYARLAVGLPGEAMSIANELEGQAVDLEPEILALRAAASRELGLLDQAKAGYRRIVDGTDCPAWIAFGWLGLAALGDDPCAAFASIVDPAVLGDAIAAAFTREPKVHDTVDGCDDRINCALALIGGAAAAGRLVEARARHLALLEYLRGPAPLKYVDASLEQAELMRLIGARTDAALLAGTLRIASGGAFR